MIELGVVYGFVIGCTCENIEEFDLRIYLGIIYLRYTF